MEIDEKFDDEHMWEAVTSAAEEYVKVFNRIRPTTNSDLCAWFMTQAWIDWQERESKLARSRRKPEVPASGVQVCLLNALGVAALADLSRAEAQSIIEQVQKEKSRKVEKEWY